MKVHSATWWQQFLPFAFRHFRFSWYPRSCRTGILNSPISRSRRTGRQKILSTFSRTKTSSFRPHGCQSCGLGRSATAVFRKKLIFNLRLLGRGTRRMRCPGHSPTGILCTRAMPNRYRAPPRSNEGELDDCVMLSLKSIYLRSPVGV